MTHMIDWPPLSEIIWDCRMLSKDVWYCLNHCNLTEKEKEIRLHFLSRHEIAVLLSVNILCWVKCLDWAKLWKWKQSKNQNIQKKMIFQTNAKVVRQIEIWSKSWWKEFAPAPSVQVQVSRKSWEIRGSKTQQADSASQADYPQQLVLSFSDYDEIMMYLIID